MRESGYNYFTRHLSEAVQKAVQECETAEDIIEHIITTLSQECGGMVVYIPILKNVIRDRRNAQIRKEFNGKNHSDLARKYKLSVTWIYKIIGEAEK